MKKILLCALLVIGAPCIAALPPFSQSKKELESILASPEINHYIPQSDMIMQIIRTNGGYLIVTNYRTVFVAIEYLPQKEIGPSKFNLKFHKAIPLVPEEAGDMEADMFTNEQSENFTE